MHTPEHQIEQLETAFWQSMVDGKPKLATDLLAEPALMVSGHGSMTFDHAGYTKMANDPSHRLVAFALSDFSVLFPREDVAVATYKVEQEVEYNGKRQKMPAVDSSTWVKLGGDWKCVAHTESLQAPKQ